MGEPKMPSFSMPTLMVFGSIPNKYSYPFLLKACALAGGVEEGKQGHAHVVKMGFSDDRFVRSTGIQMYAAFGMMGDARRMINGKKEMDPVCWNSMIDGYLKCGELEKARGVFDEMPCRNVGSWNAMLFGYAKFGMIDVSRELFESMPERDEISWSAMINGYLQCGCSKEVVAVFHRMQKTAIAPKQFVLSSVLKACADVGALEQGGWVHAYITRKSIVIDAVLGTSLIDMYAKCGQLDMSKEVFEEMTSKEVFTWNAMMTGLAVHGHGNEALELFSRMQREGFEPNAISFVGVLNACSHTGLVEDGSSLFNSMVRDYGMTPTMEHYGCMVDLLGRAGHLVEAEDMIKSMPFKPNAIILRALLGACRIHGDVALGERVAKMLIEVEPQHSGGYVLLSNIYAKGGRWNEVSRIRKAMKNQDLKTIPGSSLIECDGVIHEFMISDSSHPKIKEIHAMLEEVYEKLGAEGYVPKTKEFLFDIDEEDKEMTLRYHSEKLAVSFGLLGSKLGTTIRIVKNLRVCEDCHDVMKLISRIYGRELVVRDRVRFHHMKDGSCSCNEFW